VTIVEVDARPPAHALHGDQSDASGLLHVAAAHERGSQGVLDDDVTVYEGSDPFYMMTRAD
jgi:hypothetical protein